MTIDSKALEAALDRALEFVQGKLPALHKEKGLVGIFCAAFRNGWSSALRELPPPKVEGEPVRYEIIDHTGCIHYANDAEHAEKLRQTLVHPSPVLADEGVTGWHKALNAAALIADACEMQQEIDHGAANTGGAAAAAAAIRALSPPPVTP